LYHLLHQIPSKVLELRLAATFGTVASRAGLKPMQPPLGALGF